MRNLNASERVSYAKENAQRDGFTSGAWNIDLTHRSSCDRGGLGRRVDALEISAPGIVTRPQVSSG
jgi:hypothetical protein